MERAPRPGAAGGAPSGRAGLVWLGAALLAAALLAAALLAEVDDPLGSALLLPTAALFLWYRRRFLPEGPALRASRTNGPRGGRRQQVSLRGGGGGGGRARRRQPPAPLESPARQRPAGGAECPRTRQKQPDVAFAVPSGGAPSWGRWRSG